MLSKADALYTLMNVPWFPPSSSFSRSADQPNIGLLETEPCDNGTRRCVERRREEMGGDFSEDELRIDTSEMISSSSNLLLLRAFFVANTFCRHMNCRRTFAILQISACVMESLCKLTFSHPLDTPV